MRNKIRLLLVGFALVGSVFALSGIAGAQDSNSNCYPSCSTAPRNSDLSNSSEVLSTGVTKNASAEATTASASAAAPASALAFTGSDVFVLSMIGGVAVVAGAAILVARRRMAQA